MRHDNFTSPQPARLELRAMRYRHVFTALGIVIFVLATIKASQLYNGEPRTLANFVFCIIGLYYPPFGWFCWYLNNNDPEPRADYAVVKPTSPGKHQGRHR